MKWLAHRDWVSDCRWEAQSLPVRTGELASSSQTSATHAHAKRIMRRNYALRALFADEVACGTVWIVAAVRRDGASSSVETLSTPATVPLFGSMNVRGTRAGVRCS
eukprot:6652159-Pyramimonas_sp.AAC.1